MRADNNSSASGSGELLAGIDFLDATSGREEGEIVLGILVDGTGRSAIIDELKLRASLSALLLAPTTLRRDVERFETWAAVDSSCVALCSVSQNYKNRLQH